MTSFIFSSARKHESNTLADQNRITIKHVDSVSSFALESLVEDADKESVYSKVR